MVKWFFWHAGFFLSEIVMGVSISSYSYFLRVRVEICTRSALGRQLGSLFSRAAKVGVAKAQWILQAVAQEPVEAHMRQSDKPHCKRDGDTREIAIRRQWTVHDRGMYRIVGNRANPRIDQIS